MIELRGTSHIASNDLADIRALVQEREPDVVALELDERRLKALLNQEQRTRTWNPFFLLLKWMQNALAKRTGAVPGEDMLAAFEAAAEQGSDIALIDQDITVTFRKIRGIPLLEKLKVMGYTVVGGISSTVLGNWLFDRHDIDLREVPDQETVTALLSQLESRFPALHEVLVAERNDVMAEKLKALDEQYDDVLAFVGAGHVQGVEALLEDAELQVSE